MTATVLFVLGLSFLGVGAASQHASPPQAPAAVAQVGPSTAADPASAEPSSTPRSAPPKSGAAPAAAHTSPEPAAAPVRLRVPAIAVDTTVPHLGIDDDGVLEVPDDPDLVGWFSLGTAPGDVGAAVMAGHVDSPEGRGVFFELAEVAPGDEVLVDRDDGTTASFRVERVVHYPKDDLPTVEIYAATGRELRLITCGGQWDGDTASYRDNIVAYATLVDSTGRER